MFIIIITVTRWHSLEMDKYLILHIGLVQPFLWGGWGEGGIGLIQPFLGGGRRNGSLKWHFPFFCIFYFRQPKGVVKLEKITNNCDIVNLLYKVIQNFEIYISHYTHILWLNPQLIHHMLQFTRHSRWEIFT